MTTDTKAVARWGKDGVDYQLQKQEDGHFVMFIDHEQVVAELNAKVERLDDGETRAIKERDHAEEVIDKLCDAVLGSDRAEWSSAYYFHNAIEDVEDEIANLRSALAAKSAEVEGLRAELSSVLEWATNETTPLRDQEIQSIRRAMEKSNEHQDQ